MAGGSLGWKVLATGSALVAGIAAKKLLEARGRRAPARRRRATRSRRRPPGPRRSAGRSLSGVVYGLARLVATRQAAGYYKRSTGHLPKGLEDVGA